MSTPPSIEMLHKLQLFRTTLVNFLDWTNFSDVVTGCYVRVLLEMRSDDTRRDGGDHYYIACVKGAKKGPTYSGFLADTATTEWHIVIELPPCFRTTQNGNVLQLNSISNSPFRLTEYQTWVQVTQRAKQSFPTLPQLQFRLGMLEEHKQQALTPEPRRKKAGEDSKTVLLRESKLLEKRTELREEVLMTHFLMPKIESLKIRKLDELQEIERQLLEMITAVRVVINERSKCMVCRNYVCTEICYPCKHQVLCKDCAVHIGRRCPVHGCTTPVERTFHAFMSQ